MQSYVCVVQQSGPLFIALYCIVLYCCFIFINISLSVRNDGFFMDDRTFMLDVNPVVTTSAGKCLYKFVGNLVDALPVQ